MIASNFTFQVETKVFKTVLPKVYQKRMKKTMRMNNQVCKVCILTDILKLNVKKLKSLTLKLETPMKNFRLLMFGLVVMASVPLEIEFIIENIFIIWTKIDSRCHKYL